MIEKTQVSSTSQSVIEVWCTQTEVAPKFSLFEDKENFPSLNALNEICPNIPNINALNKSIDDSFKDFIVLWGDFFETLFYPFLKLLVFSEKLLLSTPWWLVITIILFITYGLTKKKSLSIFVLIAFCAMGFFGLWNQTMQTLSFILICALICVLFGIPIGIAMALKSSFSRLITPVLDILQTMPSFVYLIPVVMLFGVGKVAGAISVIFYSIPPVIRFTEIGIKQVDKSILEVADSFGSNTWQKLLYVQLPLAKPIIIAGINQTIMMALAMVVIASMVGVRGLGIEVLTAVTNQYLALGIFSGLAVVLLAIIIDRVTKQGFEQIK